MRLNSKYKEVKRLRQKLSSLKHIIQDLKLQKHVSDKAAELLNDCEDIADQCEMNESDF